MNQAAAGDERPIVNIVGEKVALGPLHLGLLPLVVRWENDFRTMEVSGEEPRPSSPEAVAAGWEPLIKGERSDWVGFAIYERPGLRPIGYANLRDVANPNRTAEFGIYIGETGCHGKGYGTEVTRLVLEFAFTVLGVHNVWLDTVADNLAALRAYEKAGFKEIGRRRQARRRGERFLDVVLMDCLPSDLVPPATRSSLDP